MRLLRVGPIDAQIPEVVLDDRTALDLTDAVGTSPEAWITDKGVSAARIALANPSAHTRLDVTFERRGSPLTSVGKIICVGLDYRKHAVETKQAIPNEPILFLKTAYTVQRPNDPVWIPRRSLKTDYEVELAIVISREARYLHFPSEALDYVLGYAISDDVSERGFQTECGGQWDRGRNCETFNPFGPWITTVDEVRDPQQLRLSSQGNGEVWQDSSTSDMILDCASLVWCISQFMALLLGDVINTGTPEGVGMGFTSERFLRHGETIELAITTLGSQIHRVVDCDRRFEKVGTA